MWAPNAPASRTSPIGGLPACSTSRSMPARRAALASWIARMSFCVIAIRSSSAPHSTYENVRPSSTMRCVRELSSPRITPSWSITPARNISATTSMMPEPQIPETSSRRVASANPGSSDHRSAPITLRRGSSEIGSIRTPSIAPAVARCPELIWAPSNAGPVGLEAANWRRRSPSTISALVPTSTSSWIDSERCGPSARIAAAVSAPTWPAMHGPTQQRACGSARSSWAAAADTASLVASVNGAWPSGVGSMPNTMWCMIGLPTTTTSSTRSRSAPDLFDQFSDQFVERTADRVGQLAIAAGVHHHVRHSAHQVFAELDLRVHPAGARQHLAGGDVAQVPGDRGRADVDGHAEGGIDETGPRRDHLLPLVDRDRDGAVAAVDRRLQRGEHRERRRRTRAAVLHRNRRGEHAGCRRIVAELGLARPRHSRA